MRSVYVLCPMYLTVLYVVNYMCSFQCAMCNPFLNIAHRSDLKSLIQVEVKSRLDPIATLHGVIIKISNWFSTAMKKIKSRKNCSCVHFLFLLCVWIETSDNILDFVIRLLNTSFSPRLPRFDCLPGRLLFIWKQFP
jgi:hypothetical protein